MTGAPYAGQAGSSSWFNRRAIILAAAAIGWASLAVSDYALLTGRNAMRVGEHEEVRCSYWTGLRRHRLKLYGQIGSEDVNCPNVLNNVEKR